MIIGVAPKVCAKGVALKVGEKAATHLTRLHAPVSSPPAAPPLCLVRFTGSGGRKKYPLEPYTKVSNDASQIFFSKEGQWIFFDTEIYL